MAFFTLTIYKNIVKKDNTSLRRKHKKMSFNNDCQWAQKASLETHSSHHGCEKRSCGFQFLWPRSNDIQICRSNLEKIEASHSSSSSSLLEGTYPAPLLYWEPDNQHISTRIHLFSWPKPNYRSERVYEKVVQFWIRSHFLNWGTIRNFAICLRFMWCS